MPQIFWQGTRRDRIVSPPFSLLSAAGSPKGVCRLTRHAGPKCGQTRGRAAIGGPFLF